MYRFIAQARNQGETWRTSTPASVGHTPLPGDVPNNAARRASDPVSKHDPQAAQVRVLLTDWAVLIAAFAESVKDGRGIWVIVLGAH